ncbi:MAG: DUF1893 domain-containing protein [Solobacterium sp.]|nr:DUF1893 domain-containing protein [Solobacterium sp.]
MKNQDIIHARELLTEDITCVVCKGEDVLTSKDHGVKPLMTWIREGKDFHGYSAADRVIGRAAAFLYTILGVTEVHAELMSRNGLAVLEKNGINYTYDSLIDNILNQTKTDLCPMEKLTLQYEEPQEAYEALKIKIAELMKNKK